MSAKDTFNISRFSLLVRQYFIHNNRIMLYSVIGYCGVVFLVLSMVQLEDSAARPLDVEYFIAFLTASVAVIGILFTGHSFQAFRASQTTANYLTIPASTLEKFLFELFYRFGSTLIILPLLFWVTFHSQGYFFQLFIESKFIPVSFTEVVQDLVSEADNAYWIITFIAALSMFALSIAFTGAAHFSKQPLVKTLFSVTVIILFFVVFIYVVFEQLGLESYRLNESLWLLPSTDTSAFRSFSIAAILGTLLMLSVSFLKLKEKEA